MFIGCLHFIVGSMTNEWIRPCDLVQRVKLIKVFFNVNLAEFWRLEKN